jgi:hypothetical protein
MNLKQQRKLLRDIAIECERAYRRGYQQGFIAARQTKVEISKVTRWRFAYKRTMKIIAPPGTPHEGHRDDAIERLNAECPLHSSIKNLIYETPEVNSRFGTKHD